MKFMTRHHAILAMPDEGDARILLPCDAPRHRQAADVNSPKRFNLLEIPIMAWTTPVATDLRFGFEVTMYIATR